MIARRSFIQSLSALLLLPFAPLADAISQRKYSAPYTPAALKDYCKFAVGRVNSEPFGGFPAGELLFLGSSWKEKEDEFEVVYSFSFSPTIGRLKPSVLNLPTLDPSSVAMTCCDENQCFAMMGTIQKRRLPLL